MLVVMLAFYAKTNAQDSLFIFNNGQIVFRSSLFDVDSMNFGDAVAVPQNNTGTGYVRDIDGNEYKTVVIGSQTVMAENLKVTRLNDGTLLPNLVAPTEWASTVKPAICWYLNDKVTYHDSLGAIYNWYAVATAKICPLGWHVPTMDEWNVLYSSVGSVSELMYRNSKYGANIGTNESGFSATPSPIRKTASKSQTYFYLEFQWMSRDTDYSAITVELEDFDSHRNSSMILESGASIRCFKD